MLRNVIILSPDHFNESLIVNVEIEHSKDTTPTIIKLKQTPRQGRGDKGGVILLRLHRHTWRLGHNLGSVIQVYLPIYLSVCLGCASR